MQPGRKPGAGTTIFAKRSCLINSLDTLLMPKIVTRIFGGLGNQLFCYAAARRLALSANAELVIDSISGFGRNDPYNRAYGLNHFNIPCRTANFIERLEPFSRARRYLKRRLNEHRPFEVRSYIQQEGREFDPRLIHLRPTGTLYLEGYWQSDRYFSDVEDIIRTDLQVISLIDQKSLAVATQIRSKKAVAVHLRFFSNPGSEETGNASQEYYVEAIRVMECIAPDSHYFVFSDRPADAQGRLTLPSQRTTFVTHNDTSNRAYADFWLMEQCQHFIIANSTFSWWAAWLSNNIDKRVICPGFTITAGETAWNFDGQLPQDWIKI